MSPRVAFVSLSTVVAVIGCWLGYKGMRVAGFTAIFGGLAGIAIELLLQRRDRLGDEAEQRKWIAEVRAAADDVNLDGYGIPSLEELARYHDAEGRTAVLAALMTLPVGRRALLAAAQNVEPDASWD
jgi:hypothetical protein